MNKLIIFLFIFLVSCKVQDGDNPINSCASPADCYEEYLACDSTIYYNTHELTNFNITSSNTNYYFAQSFQLQRSERLHSFTIALQQANSPVGTVHMELRNDCAGSPCSTVVATSSTIDMASISTVATNTSVTFNFDNWPILSADTSYWALVYLPLDGQGAPTIYLKTGSADPYSLGVFKTSNNSGASWNDALAANDAFLRINVCE